jgi:hypothetical protein
MYKRVQNVYGGSFLTLFHLLVFKYILKDDHLLFDDEVKKRRLLRTVNLGAAIPASL